VEGYSFLGLLEEERGEKMRERKERGERGRQRRS
jgi:hypothetical protein